MLTTASCRRECTRCFCFAAPSNFAFTWATGITIHINSCPVKCSRNVAGSGHFVDGRLHGSNRNETQLHGLVMGSPSPSPSVVSEARRGKAPARARCVRALSIQRLEGSRPRLQRTRALCKLNGVEGWRGGVLGSCGGAQQLTRWVAKLAMTKECCEESA